MTSAIWGWRTPDRHTFCPMYVGADIVRWRNVSAGAHAILKAFTARNDGTQRPKRLQANGEQKQSVAFPLRWERDRRGAD